MKKSLFVIILTGVLVLLFLVNPEHSVLMPKCPFRLLTGLDCPACGTQRAIYHSLHLNFGTAFGYNPFLIISMPYLLALVLTNWLAPDNKFIKLKRFVNHPVTVRTYLVLLIIWWVGRNLW